MIFKIHTLTNQPFGLLPKSSPQIGRGVITDSFFPLVVPSSMRDPGSETTIDIEIGSVRRVGYLDFSIYIDSCYHLVSYYSILVYHPIMI